jgi:solute carrier family 25 oxoglutarate transporter 11
VARNFVAANGVMGLYNGLSAGILRQLTYGMSRLGLFRSMTNHFSEGGKRKLTLGESTLCSLVAGGIGALIGTPADAALIRMQADTTLPMAERRNYKNGVDAMIRMAREEGMRGFFAGATPTIVRGLALNVGMLASYDKLKEFGGQYLGGENTKSNLIFSSIGSGILGATFALPLDLIKTKLQKQRPLPDGKMPFSGMLDCARKTLAAEGPTGFYKGYPTFLLRITPHIVMVWLFMEAFNKSKYLK